MIDFMSFIILWYFIGLLSSCTVVYYQWKIKGCSITLGECVAVVFMSFGGLVITLLVITIAFIEVVDWKRPVIRGRNDHSRYR